MSRAAVPVDEPTREALEELARSEGRPVDEVLRNAVEEYRARKLLDETNGAFDELRRDPEAWRRELEERAEWEATLMDGLAQ